MKKQTTEKEKYINLVLISSLVIIIMASIESLMMAKDKAYFLAFKDVMGVYDFTDYINLIIFDFISLVVQPVITALYTYFAGKKGKLNKAYKIFFAAATVIEIVNAIFQMRFRSVFYYGKIIFFIVLLYAILKMPLGKEKNEISKNPG